MDKEEILKKVKEVLKDKLNIDSSKIQPESSLIEDLGVDSFDTIEIIFGLEEAFDISISENELANIKKVEDMVHYLIMHVERKGQ